MVLVANLLLVLRSLGVEGRELKPGTEKRASDRESEALFVRGLFILNFIPEVG